ncbi:hypothetical protein P4B35_06435 [Pontiellaceae bacterium B12227]|nr:hypothetical protein [Pontiellaceae bacterium B12227]
MKNRTRIITAAIAAATLGAVSAQAASIEWDNGASDGVWTNPVNWAGDVLPTSADLAYISSGDTVNFIEGYTNTVNRNIIRGGSILNITGGKLTGQKSGNTVRDIVGQTSGHSYLNQTGGEYTSSHVLRIGSGAAGTVNLSGGSATVGRAGTSLFGNPNTSIQIDSLGTLNVTNSTLYTRTGVEIVNGGVFHVYGGYSPEIQLGAAANHASDGDWYQQSNSVLRVGISTNGLTPIVLENNGEDGTPITILDAGSVLDVGFVDDAMETNFWAVLDGSAGVFNNLGMVFDSGVNTNDWGYIVSNNVLYVGYGLGWPAGEDVQGPPPSGRDLYWTGAGGDTASDNPTNWVLDTAATLPATWGPYDMDKWRIGHISVTGVETGINYTVDYDATAVNNGQGDLDVGDGAQGTLNYNSGSLSFGVVNSRQEFGLSGGDGTLNMNGGTLGLNTARFGLSAGTGTFNLNGGTLNIGRAYADYSLWLGHNNNSTGIMNVTGGRIFTRMGIKLGDGGSGIGIFNVEGSAATLIGIGSNSALDGRWTQNAGSVLSIKVDAGGVTPITVVNKDAGIGGSDGDVYFYDGALLDLGWMPGVTNFGTFKVMEWDGQLQTNELALASSVDTNVWSYSITDENSDGTNDTLWATAYGETANGTPIPWLLENGLTADDDEIDNDGDGLETWEEYITGTIPTDSNSVLVVTSLENLGGDNYAISWKSVTNRSYSIVTNANLAYPNPGDAAVGIPGAAGETSVTSSIPSEAILFFEVGTSLPE